MISLRSPRSLAMASSMILWALISTTGAAGPSHAGQLSGKIRTSEDASSASAQPTVVWIEGVEAGGVPSVDTILTHKGGTLGPKLSVGFVGQNFVLRNDDTNFHNMHLYMKLAYQMEASQRPLQYGATLYNVPLPLQGKEITKAIKPYHRYRDETGFIVVTCNAHPEERAYVLVFDHPFCAIADEGGSYRIEGIPAGRYGMFAFRDGVVTEIGEVGVEDGATTEHDLQLR